MYITHNLILNRFNRSQNKIKNYFKMLHLRAYQLRLLYTCIAFGSLFLSFFVLSIINGSSKRPDFKNWDLPSTATKTKRNAPQFYFNSTKNNIPPKKGNEEVNDDRGHRKPQVVDYRSKDRDQDLMDMVQIVYSLFPNDTKSVECGRNVSIKDYYKEHVGISFPMADNWDIFFSKITSCELFQNYNDADALLHDLATMDVKEFDFMHGGTQIKLLATFQNGKRAILKPMRYPKEDETDPNHFYYTSAEQHHAEIATFHLDRVLGMHRSIPTVGRVFNLTNVHAVATHNVQESFFFSPVKNLCFTAKCKTFCGAEHPVCGDPILKEFSVQAYLPSEEFVPRDHIMSPYRRSYSKGRPLADFQENAKYCQSDVLTDAELMQSKRRLLDVIDAHVIDFLTRNQDRHHMQSMTIFDGMPGIHKIYNLFMDNGKGCGFGIHSSDDMDILLPLTQCCLIRPSTLKVLLKYYSGPISISKALQLAMVADPTYPVLIPPYYKAIERRLQTILTEILKCIKQNRATNVLVTSVKLSPPKEKKKRVRLRFVDGKWKETYD